MEITLEMLFGLNENLNITLGDQNGKIIGKYNGKDSIDVKYNDNTVIYLKAIDKDGVYVEIYVDDEEK